MALEIAVGTGLVLLTWLVSILAMAFAGLLPAALMAGGRLTSVCVRAAMWWGLLLLSIAVVLVNLVWPLRSTAAALTIGIFILVMAVAGIIVARRRGFSLGRRPESMQWLLIASLGLATLYLAAAALGPVTNYDSGLYHLGAIGYAGDYATVPGLANLYFPLGYSNAEFPLAAFLGNGPWDGTGFRLLNGLLLTMVAVDLLLRVRERRRTVGFFVLAVGVAAAWVPMIALSDYWVTSPTSDSAVLALSLVTAAYLTDAVSSGRSWWLNTSVSVALATLMVMLRPTMAVYAVAVVGVLLVAAWHGRERVLSRGSALAASVVGASVLMAACATGARDYVLSGWLQYPLSVHAFDVDWVAPDPVDARTATLGAARDPLDLWAAADGWEWIPNWIGGLAAKWETYEFALLGVVAAVLLVLAARSRAGMRMRPLLLAMAPSVAAVSFWWLLTPPAFRFIWGPLFTLAAIPAGWALWRLSMGAQRRELPRPWWPWVTVVGVAVPIMAVSGFSVIVRFDAAQISERRTWTLGVQVPYAVAPITVAPVVEQVLPSGLTILVPVDSDQCWANYPMCSPMAIPTLHPRGLGIAEGFRP